MIINANQHFTNANFSHSDLQIAEGDISFLNNVQIIKVDDLYFFDCFVPENINKRIDLYKVTENFLDETGIECSVNHFHVICPNFYEATGKALTIFAKVAEIWNQSNHSEGKHIKQIVTLVTEENGLFELTYRFHLIRTNQSWIASNLNLYEEIVLTCE